MRSRRRSFGIRRLHVVLAIGIVLLVYIFIFIPPANIYVIVGGMSMLALVISGAVMAAWHDRRAAAVTGQFVFFLLTLYAVQALDLINLTLLVAFTVMLAVLLYKKE
ncbi:MAG: hypothetical protein ACE5DQ_02280 [Candidatus Paceibacterota bacterium]